MDEDQANSGKKRSERVMSEERRIALPEELCRAVEKKYAHRFGGLEELLTAALQELGRDDAIRMDENEEQIIAERLKGLGYV
jgi:hypothetical protein